MRIAILVPAPGHRDNWQAAAENYRRLFGPALEFRPWTDPGDLSGFDLALPLLAWGYQREPERWYAMLDTWSGLPFANPVPLVRWNTDKAYLLALEAQGVSIVPTRIAARIDTAALEAARHAFGESRLVVKPSISGGADGTWLLEAGDSPPASDGQAAMLIQPHMPAIGQEGEYSLFYFGGRFSHAILKRPAAGDFRVQEQFGGTEIAIDPPAEAQVLAHLVLAALPEQPLYARIDMVRDGQGSFRLMEVELIEPALFFAFAPDKGAMFAEAIRRHLEILCHG